MNRAEQKIEGSYVTPSVEHATVTDAMRPHGVVGCGVGVPVRVAGRVA